MRSKWLFLLLLAMSLATSRTSLADDNIRATQSRLQKDGFYNGKLTGHFDSETSAALTRYQIRRGLAINGQLDAATAHALGVEPNEKSAPPDPATWRQLRQSDEKFLERLNHGVIPPPPNARLASASIPDTTTKNTTIDPHAPPPPPPENPLPAPPPPAPVPGRRTCPRGIPSLASVCVTTWERLSLRVSIQK